MKYYYIVVFTSFNIMWYPEMVGKRFKRVPPNCRHIQVQKLVDNGTFEILEN